MILADYAQLAARAYTEPPTIGVECSAARAVVFPAGVVGFPGTNNISCWLADLQAIATPVPGMGRVHHGFWHAFQEIAEPLLALSDVQVTLGHSEGASLAILFAAALCLAGRPPRAVYAFEPPRVSCDDTLAQLFQAHGVELTLTQHGNDLVPMIPRLCEPWRHAGPLLALGKPARPFPNVEDHLMAGVIAALMASPAG